MEMKRGHAALNAECTCKMDMQDGQAAWTSMEKQHEHEAWTSSMDMQHGQAE
jgi:hypothetical protein